jgi:nucleoside-diphosphate-sugar epimerase
MHDPVKLIEEDAARVCSAVDLTPLDGRTLLLTGASGLVGIYLLACLRVRMRQSGKPVHVIATINSELPDYLKGFFEAPTIDVRRFDLANPGDHELPPADFIIHAAGYAQPTKFSADPVKTITLNTTATKMLLDRLKPDGRFLFVSTSEVYSGSPNTPYRESDIGTTTPAHFRACYIEGKRCGEAICYGFQAGGATVRIARLSLAYGPGTRREDERVLSSLTRRGISDGAISLMDQGAARRTYGYITDVIEMLFGILLYGKETVYNVGGRSATTILGLAEEIGAQLGVPVTVPPPDAAAGLTGAPMDVSVDLSRVCEEFGKTSFVPMDEGLRRCIEWQRAITPPNAT